MVRKYVGAAVLALGLAACGETPPNETAVTPPAVDDPVETDTSDMDAPETLMVEMGAVAPGDVLAAFSGPTLVFEKGDLATVAVDATTTTITRLMGVEGGETAGGSTAGAAVQLDYPSEYDIAGETLIVDVEAASAGDVAVPFKLAYSTASNGNSGWFDFEATTERQTFSFTYELPGEPDDNQDFLGLLPSGETGVEVYSVTITVDG